MRLLNPGPLRHRMNVGLSLRCNHGRLFHTLYEFRWYVRSCVTRLTLLTRSLTTIVRREGCFALGLLPPAAFGSGFEAVPSPVLVHATSHHGDQEEGHEAEGGLHR